MSTWNPDRLIVGRPLTDARIAHYQALGWYSPEVRAMRRARNERRMAKQAQREGNFVKENGRLIYSPL